MKRIARAAVFLWVGSAVILSAQTLETIYNFDGTDGAQPAGLVQGTNGSLYGATSSGGNSGYGTAFRINLSGKLTTLYEFCSQTNCADGASPYAGLTQATNGNVYGTTYGGGGSGGTFFKIAPSGELTTLYAFGSESGDGFGPDGVLVEGTNGDFYGTTVSGGAHSAGTVFKITPSGKLTTLHSFCSKVVAGQCADGNGPEAGLIQATDGNFYGTTAGGGSGGNGTVFKVTPAGKLTTLYSFCSLSACADGSLPEAPLIQGSDGDFYGTTGAGGGSGNNGGTVFKSLRAAV